MKKNTRKLVLRREAVRTLDRIELTHALGGGDSPDVAAGTDRTQSGINCVAQAAAVPK